MKNPDIPRIGWGLRVKYLTSCFDSAFCSEQSPFTFAHKEFCYILVADKPDIFTGLRHIKYRTELKELVGLHHLKIGAFSKPL
ncbi:hypothetical protein D3C86_1888710 [compost metagenome]